MPRFRIFPVSMAALAILSTTLACSIGSSARTPTPAPQPTVELPSTIPPAAETEVPTKIPFPLDPLASEPPAVTATINAPKGVVILDKSAYTDGGGYYHVVGEVLNNTDAAITNVQLAVSIADASGKSVLKDSDNKEVDTIAFSPMLYPQPPRQISPFPSIHYPVP